MPNSGERMRGRYALVAAALGWAVIATAPDAAAAQCRLCETPSAERESPTAVQPVTLEVEAVLDFDQLILTGSGDGVATLLPDGTRSVSDSVGGFSGRAMVGSVSVRGEPGRAVRIDLPRRIELYSRGGGGRMAIDKLTTDLPAAARLDSAGRLTFRFGGRLQVSGDSEGDYRGDLPITVEYQ